MVQNDDHPDVIALPPYILLAFLVAGLALDMMWPAPVLPGTAQFYVGPVLIAAGVGLMASAVRRFNAAGTNVPTPLPATAIVTGGPYRFTRNPIYASMAIGFVGVAVTVDSLWLMAIVVPFMTVIHFGVVKREERYLENKFGAAYGRYRASVRRWI
jgi:protein-S-isoprenylcysteine O-methyltransferase Ste14